jgi:hypothetical protein
MRWKIWLPLIGILVVVVSVIGYPLFVGFRYRSRAVSYANKAETTEEMKSIKDGLFARGPSDISGGILARVFANLVGVWGEKGLMIFRTDSKSAFLYVDGCSLGINAIELGKGDVDLTMFSDWRGQLKRGDFVVV